MKLDRLTLLIGLTLLLTACSFSLAADITPPPGAAAPVSTSTRPPLSGPLYPLVAPNPAAGEAIFAQKCAPCHGNTGQGDGSLASNLANPPAPLGSPELTRQTTPAERYAIVTQGNMDRLMPPFNSLSESQRWDVVAYVYTLGNPPEVVAQGQELYAANCARCHGERGQGDGPDAAGLSVPPANFTDQALMAKKSAADLFQTITTGDTPNMPAFGEQLTADERWSLTAFLRTLTFGAQRAETLEGTPEPTEAAATEGTAPLEGSSTSSGVGTISGKVINVSGAEIPAGLVVTLHGFDNMQQTFTQTVTAAADGIFTFEDVSLPVGRAFITSLQYQRVTYTSDVIVAEADTDLIDLPIPVYESTSDPAVLSVDQLHIFVEYVEPDTLRMVEWFIISNLSDRTLVAAEEGKPVIAYSLPVGAVNLQFEDGGGRRFIKTANGFGDTFPVRPGAKSYQLAFAFDLPYKRKLDFVQPFDMPINATAVLFPEGSFKVKSDQLQDAGVRTIQNTSYRSFTSKQLAAGSELSLTISGRPSSGSAGLVTSSRNELFIGVGTFGLALIVAGVWLYRRKQAADLAEMSEDAQAGAAFAESPIEDADTLMEAIIALDDLYQAGDLPEEAYRQRRAELKARLEEVMG